MAAISKEVAVDLSPHLVLFTDYTIKRFNPETSAPPSDDSNATVRSKDVVINSENGISVRIYVPRQQNPPQKLPLIFYVHGGAFCVGSASSPIIHNFVYAVVEKSNSISVSVDYRIAPESQLTNTYEDSWTAFQWVAAHVQGKGTDPWINEYADFKRVFLGGDSAGANIANDVAIRAGIEKFNGVEVEGMFLMHPFYGGKEVDKLYKFLCPTSSGLDDDPRLFPPVHPKIQEMAGKRVMFFTADKDSLRDRTRACYEGLKKSEWSGQIDIFETEGEGHCFYLHDLNSAKAVAIMDRLIAFLKHTPSASFKSNRRTLSAKL